MRAAVLLLPLLLTGCRNDCQKLCKQMAQYAEDECGLEWSKDAIQECSEAFTNAEVDRDQREVCQTISADLETEWTCETIEDYFDEEPAESSTGDTG